MTLDLERAARRLEEEMAQVENDLTSVRSDLDDEIGTDQELSQADQHPADSGTETFNFERDRSLAEVLERRVDELRRARAKIDEGRYGLCERCGRPIDEERLAALPAARFCMADELVVENEASG